METAQRRMEPLVDRFNRPVTYLRLSVTDRCNFRCVYCMPAEGLDFGPNSTLLTFEEIERLVRLMAAGGVRRVRLTGGEPLVRRDLPALVARLSAIEGVDQVVMTTNGHQLGRCAEALREAGLTGLTVSLDSLDEARFAQITRGGELSAVLAGIEAASRAGFEGIKINAVIIRGFNDDELDDMVAWAVERGHILRMIEFMPIGADTIWGQGGCVPVAEMEASLGLRWSLEPLGEVASAGPARYFRVAGRGGQLRRGEGKVGFISAVTRCFCDGCNRVRVTAQGGLRACLADDREVDLRALMRGGEGDEALEEAIRGSLWGKLASHSFNIDGGAVTRKQMVSIGG